MSYTNKSWVETQFSNFAKKLSEVFAKIESLPTKISDLTNDSNFVEDANYIHTDNNYTTAEKNKLNGIEENAQANIIESVKVNNVAQTVTSKSVNITVPTKASDINAMDSSVTHLSGDVPTTRTINGKSLSSNITLSATDVSAIPSSQKGSNNGVAELDENGKVPSNQLPSFVDDVLEYDTKNDFPNIGESSKIYIAKDDNKTYRWSGSEYVEISQSLALGTTSTTAYRGDRGKIAYDHSKLTSGNPHNVTKTDVGLENVGNFKAVSTVASQGLTDTEKANARENIGAGSSSFSGSYNDLTDKPIIPSEVTESTVSDWGFTKNTGTYSKPSTGIPKTDLASAVRTSLGKADTALQSITSENVTTALGFTPYDATNPNGYTSNVGTITGIKMNGASKGTSGVVDLGAVITEHQSLSGYVPTTRKINGQALSSDITISIPTITDTYSATSSNGMSGKAVASAISDKANTDVATQSANGLMSSTDKTKLDGYLDWASISDVTVSNVVYHTYWLVAPTSTNKVYGVSVHPTNGRLYRVYNNNGTYTVTNYDANTTYSNFVKSGSTAKNGLVPAPPTTAGTTKYLREDGTWAEPTTVLTWK